MSQRLGLLVVLAFLTLGCARFVEVVPVGSVELDRPAETSVVIDSSGRVLAELHAEQDRELVPLERIPQVLRDAVIAVEDARFYSHAGLDARALARALWRNARDGRIVQGGSTITQQLAKNAVLTHEQTVQRKLEEASIAIQLEAALSKDEILEQYLNTVYFGHGAYGVQTAARRYFERDIEQLDLPQAALLAAMLKAPSNYDPFSDPEAARARRDLVLRRMAANGLVGDTEASAATAAPLGVRAAPSAQRWQAPYFVAHVLKLVQHDSRFAALGDEPTERADRLFRGGLRVETTLDPQWQAAAERSLADTLSDPDDPDGALVALDPATGGIRAMVGGRDYYDPDDPIARFNLAADAARQPGSTFKPIVLAAALEAGSTLEDVYPAPGSIELPPRPPIDLEAWSVDNYGGRSFGELTLRDATAYSANVVYAQLMDEVGPQAVVEQARAMGIGSALLPYRSLALGAQEVSVLDMASVQATLAAGGIHRQPSAVTRITSADGTVLYERGTVEGTRVVAETTAWSTTLAMQDVVDFGTGGRAAIQRPLAGKTGTTQDGADAWFTGFTPDMAAAVWIGFHEGRVSMVPPRTRVRVEGGTWPAEAFARFGLRALSDVPARDFPIPDVALTRVEVDTSRHCLPNAYTPRHLISERAYPTGTEPTEVCAEPSSAAPADVPDVVGLPVAEAVRILDEAGFAVEERAEFTLQLPPGFILRQAPEPGPGQTLGEGFVATVWASSADRTPVAVPDVLGLTLGEAVRLLEEADFVVEADVGCPGGATTCTGAAQRPGRVWEQTPDTGGRAPVHSVIGLSAYPGP